MELGNAAAAIFLLDQNTDPFEFIERIKDIALTFDKLTEDDKRRLSSWLKVTLSDGFKGKINGDVNELLLTSKEDVEKMTANFVKTMKDTIETEREDAVIEVVINFLDVANDETIAKKTGLDVEFVKQLRADNIK
ncbi:MAG: hypothetical protein ACRC68_03775 [Clostridium sp.]